MKESVRRWVLGRLELATLRFYFGCDLAREGIARFRERGMRGAHSLAVAIDPDDQACRVCARPGGTHYDCDEPDVGVMTLAERRRAYSAESKAAP